MDHLKIRSYISLLVATFISFYTGDSQLFGVVFWAWMLQLLSLDYRLFIMFMTLHNYYFFSSPGK